MRSFGLPKLALLAFLSLAACESAEERAERFFQSGLTLLENGDVDRALVQFRNVLQLNVRHKEARLTYANLQYERGEVGDAYGNYLRLVEQYPDTVDALIPLTEIAVLTENWEEAETHGRAARALAPTEPSVVVFNTLLDYRAASLIEDQTEIRSQVAIATDLLVGAPENAILRKIVIDDHIRSGDVNGALAQLDAALVIDPLQLDIHLIRLSVLGGNPDTSQVRAALEEMAARFPDDENVQQMLIARYVQDEDAPAAESYLRQLAERAQTSEANLAVVTFLQQSQGHATALAELDQLIADGRNGQPYRALRAAILFEDDQPEIAIAEMSALIEEGNLTDDGHDLRMILAQMLLDSGEPAEARAMAEAVLRDDDGHVAALKMKANWLIAEGRPNDAIVALRTALAQAVDDADIVTQIGQIHEEQGDLSLAGERYALAIEVSGNGPGEAIRYARLLLKQNHIDVAKSVLEAAVELSPANIDLQLATADVRSRQSDWDGVQQVIDRLRNMQTLASNQAADLVEVKFLPQDRRLAQVLNTLKEITAVGQVDTTEVTKRLGEVRRYLDAELSKAPEAADLLFLRANLDLLAEEFDAAETAYRRLIFMHPTDQQLMRALYALLTQQGRTNDAEAVLQNAIDSAPDALMPRVMLAAHLEAQKDYEAAIEIYDALYALDSTNLVVANNLASLISAHRTDVASLDRAAEIARVLRKIDIPAFQDTYGWIAYLRGNYQEAVRYLEPAAAGLPDDGIAQYHLGIAYNALGKIELARQAFQRAVDIGDHSRPQTAEAKTLLSQMTAE